MVGKDEADLIRTVCYGYFHRYFRLILVFDTVFQDIFYDPLELGPVQLYTGSSSRPAGQVQSPFRQALPVFSGVVFHIGRKGDRGQGKGHLPQIQLGEQEELFYQFFHGAGILVYLGDVALFLFFGPGNSFEDAAGVSFEQGQRGR